jgi:periplasmic protein TonB
METPMNLQLEQHYPAPSWRARSIALGIIVSFHAVLLMVAGHLQFDVPIDPEPVAYVLEIPIEQPPLESMHAVDPNWEAPSPPPPQVPALEFAVEVTQIAMPTDNRSVEVISSDAVANDGRPASGGSAGTGTAGQGSGTGDGAFAKCTTRVMPFYPGDAKYRGEEGKVTLLVELDEQGKFASIAVARSSGFPDLDAAGIAAMKKWRCSPVIEGGRPVRVIAKQEFNFSLKDRPGKPGR